MKYTCRVMLLHPPFYFTLARLWYCINYKASVLHVISGHICMYVSHQMSELMCLCSMKGDQVSSGHPIAYFGHSNIHSLGFNAMG